MGQTEVPDLDDVTDALLMASRVFVGIAAQSISELLSDLTLPQYRVLVVLATGGPQNLGSLAASLEVNPSTASRLCERLVRRQLIRRQTSRTDRREIRLSITAEGRSLYENVMDRRRTKLAGIVGDLDGPTRANLVAGLQAFADAHAGAGNVRGQAWSLGWSSRGGSPEDPSDDAPPESQTSVS